MGRTRAGNARTNDGRSWALELAPEIQTTDPVSDKMTEGRGPVSECSLRKLTAVVSWQEQSSAGAGGARLAGLWPIEKSPQQRTLGGGTTGKTRVRPHGRNTEPSSKSPRK